MNLLKIIFLFFCTWMTGELTAQTPFERYFLDKTLRFDYYHCGDSRNQEYFFDELKEEPYWAGSKAVSYTHLATTEPPENIILLLSAGRRIPGNW